MMCGLLTLFARSEDNAPPLCSEMMASLFRIFDIGDTFKMTQSRLTRLIYMVRNAPPRPPSHAPTHPPTLSSPHPHTRLFSAS